MDPSLVLGQLHSGLPASVRDIMSRKSPDYVADFTLRTQDTNMSGRVFHSGGLERREMLLGEGATKIKTVTILRPDKKVVWVVLPKLGTYTEVPIASSESDTEAESDWQVDKVEKGAETIDGNPANKSVVTARDSAGNCVQVTEWMSDQGILLRMELTGRGPRFDGSELRAEQHLAKLKVGTVDQSLFELPGGVTKSALPSPQSVEGAC